MCKYAVNRRSALFAVSGRQNRGEAGRRQARQSQKVRAPVSYICTTAQGDEKEKALGIAAIDAPNSPASIGRRPIKTVGQSWLAADKRKRSNRTTVTARLRRALDRTVATSSPNAYLRRPGFYVVCIKIFDI